METAKHLLALLESRDIELYLDQGNLKTKAAQGAITGDIGAQIKANREGLIALLSAGAFASTGVSEDGGKARVAITASQRQLWLSQKLSDVKALYNVSLTVRLRGALDEDALVRALRGVVERHQALRTQFVEQDGEVVAYLLEPGLELGCHRLDAQRDTTDVLRRRVAELAARPFDLSQDLLFRADLIQVGSQEHVLVLCMHHIVTDSWSCAILVKELEALYNSAPGEAQLPGLPMQFADYARWLAEPEQQRREAAHLEYWREQLHGLPAVHALPLDHPRPRVQSYEGAESHHRLSDTLVASVRAFAVEHGTTVYSVLQAVLALTLGRWSNEKDILIGTSSSGRDRPELESLVGFFVNPLILRNRISGDATVVEYLNSARCVLLDAFEHQQIPFERIVGELLLARSASHAPVFQIMFDYQATGATRVALNGLDCQLMPTTSLGAKYDIEITANELPENLHLRWVYAVRLFGEATIQRLQQSFEVLLAAFVASPNEHIAALPHLPDDEAAFIARSALGPRAAVARRTLPERFAAIARDQPDTVAVEFRSKTYSYADIESRANRLAQLLRTLGLSADRRAAVYMNPGPELVISILAVLKAGGAYVPIDPAYPEARIKHILEDADTQIVLSAGEAVNAVPAGRQVVRVDVEIQDAMVADQPDEAPQWAEGEEPRVAYVLYTSGSSGKPKGAIIGHASLNNYLDHAATYFHDDVRGAVVSSSIGFDATITSLLTPLLLGKRVLLLEQGLSAVLDGLKRCLLGDAHAWLFKVTPAHLSALGHECAGYEPSNTQHVLIVGGEQLDYAVIHQWRSRWLPKARYVNEYGPTETVVGCSVFSIDGDSGEIPTSGAVPIGKPIANTGLYVVNDGRLAPVGVVGELYIAGAGLAAGYLNQPDVCAQRFVSLKYVNPQQRFYRTGDLVRLRADGEFEFIRRCDDQVNIRGYRIETGEIESALRAVTGVREAAVVVQASGAQRTLAAFLQPVEEIADERAFQQRVRRELAKSLPEYMVPTAFKVIASLPLSINGKIDKAVLPEIDLNASMRLNYVAPQSDFEGELCALWQGSIGLERVGIHDNFLEIGGNSLMFVRLRAQIETRFGCKLDITAFFEYPTIAELGRHLQQLCDGVRPEGGGGVETVSRPTAAEARAPIAVIAMAGRFPDADSPDALWEKLCEGHEALRTFSNDELLKSGVSPDMLAAPEFVGKGALVEGVEWFDAGFFRMTPREAEILDPQHRLLLECSVQALESAGYGDAGKPRHCGVFLGCGENAYLANHLWGNTALIRDMGLSVLHASSNHYLATRVAYKLNLTGPAVNVATACSTSLVAVHLAVASLRLGECDMALAGGAGVSKFGPTGYLYKEGGIESPDGHCRVFDAGARGTRSGNGAGMVALKRLDDALRDGDNVLAVIKGTAINNDGSQKAGYTAPSVVGQAHVIEAALRDADLSAQQIQYVETHGTGTALGDPIEIQALRKAFHACDAQSCALGTLKPNIGHLDAAAGVAGLIKAVSALKHKQLPPSINFTRANPQIDFASSPFYVNTRLRDWSAGEGTRRAGVSSFGIGGTNAHVVIEEAPAMAASEPASRPVQLLVLSARSEEALRAASILLANDLGDDDAPALADVAYTLQVGRTAHAFRRSVECASTTEAVAALTAPIAETVNVSGHGASLVWMFPGQGTQRTNMARGLYESEPVFRESLDSCAEGLREALGLDLREILYPSDAGLDPGIDSLTQTWLAQPALFSVEYSLAALLQSYGLQPDAMIGHSLGEYVAACVAGVFSLEDGLKLVAARGRLMQAMPAGRMLSVPCDEERLRARLLDHSLDIAAINDRDTCIVSGSVDAVTALREQLASEGIASHELDTSHAFHSAMMEPTMDAWRGVLNTVVLRAPTIPFVSNLSGSFISAEEATDTEYWVKHLRRTVRFADGLDLLVSPQTPLKQQRHLIEVGPGQVLSMIAKRRSHRSPHTVMSVLARSAAQDDARALLQCIGQLWLHGVPIDWSGYHAAESRRRVPLPTYPFERQRFWVEPTQHGALRGVADDARRPHQEDWFYIPMWRIRGRETAGAAPSETLTWVLMSDTDGIGEHLAGDLRTAGQRVITVRQGSAFERLGEDEYTLTADDERHYHELARAFDRDGVCIDRLVHLWSLDPIPASIEGRSLTGFDLFEAHQRTGYYSLMFAIKVLMARHQGHHAVVHAVTRGAFRVTGGEKLAPECAPFIGLCKVAPQEYSNLRCQHLDLTCSDQQSRQEQSHAAAGTLLFGEFRASRRDKVVAFRHGARWTQTYEQQKVSNEVVAPRVKRSGVYVITGGLGQVGYALAEHFASMAAKLVLVVRDDLPHRSKWHLYVAGRSPSDPLVPKLGRLLVLESLGAQLLICKADVTDEAQMLAVFEQAEVRFGKVDGVIHCAGQMRDLATPLSELTLASSRAQFLPKVSGTMVLQRVLKYRKVDFCVLMSSLSAVIGGLGFAAYAAANAYMDAFCAARHAEGDEVWLSINWDGWRFSAEADARTAYSVSGPEGAKALAYALSWSDVPQLVLSTADLKMRIEKWVDKLPKVPTNLHLYARCRGKAVLAPSTTIEFQLVEIWQQLLGIQDIGIGDAFFEVGGDSLLATILVGQVNKTFNVNLPIRMVFEEETIERIALKIDELTKRPPQGKPLALKRSGARNPLFCIHPGSGFGRTYIAMLRHFPQDLPVYALEARGLNDGDVLPETIGDMCADYIEQIQIIQPHGPYHLFGWSFGALVAHAMAAEMQKRGLSVAKLIVIDPTPLAEDYCPDSAINEHRRDLEERLSGYKDYQDASYELKQTMISRMTAIMANNTRLSLYRDPSIFRGSTLMVIAKDSDVPENHQLFKNYILGDVIELRAPYHHNVLMTTEALKSYAPQVSEFLDAHPAQRGRLLEVATED